MRKEVLNCLYKFYLDYIDIINTLNNYSDYELELINNTEYNLIDINYFTLELESCVQDSILEILLDSYLNNWNEYEEELYNYITGSYLKRTDINIYSIDFDQFKYLLESCIKDNNLNLKINTNIDFNNVLAKLNFESNFKFIN